MQKKYGFWNFVLDAVLTIFTGGIYLLYVFIREMRNLSNSRRN